MEINICFSADVKYAPYMGVTITSILMNQNTQDNFRFYVLDGGISDADKQKLRSIKGISQHTIEFIEIDQEIFKNFPIGLAPHISTFYRLLIPKLLPNVEKAIYLDCDIIVKGSLSEFFNTDINKYYCAGVPDVTELVQTERLGIKQYCNAGVLLLNLKKWREENILEKMVEFVSLNREKIILADQDLINLLLQDKILRLNRKWNMQILGDGIDLSGAVIVDLSEAVIIHYICSKPWTAGYRSEHRSIYLDCLKNSLWSSEYEKLITKESKLCNNKTSIYLFHFLQLFSILKYDNKTKFIIFGFIPIYKIRYKHNKIKHYLFNFIPILKIKH